MAIRVVRRVAGAKIHLYAVYQIIIKIIPYKQKSISVVCCNQKTAFYPYQRYKYHTVLAILRRVQQVYETWTWRPSDRPL